jgi:hypothetical protein
VPARAQSLLPHASARLIPSQSRLAAAFNKCASAPGAPAAHRQGGDGGDGGGGSDLECFLLEGGAVCGLDTRPEDGAKVRGTPWGQETGVGTRAGAGPAFPPSCSLGGRAAS